MDERMLQYRIQELEKGLTNMSEHVSALTALVGAMAENGQPSEDRVNAWIATVLSGPKTPFAQYPNQARVEKFAMSILQGLPQSTTPPTSEGKE